MDEGFVADVREAANEEFAEAVELVESVPRPEPEDVFEEAYAELPPELERQNAELRAFVDEHDPHELER